MSCPFSAPGRQEACLSLQKSREAAMKRPYDLNECYSCAMRRKRLEGAKVPERINIPPGDFAKRSPAPVAADVSRKTLRPEPVAAPSTEETSVIDDKARERVLSRILREKSCSRSRLMNYCGVAKGELEEITVALLEEGKIKAWPKGTGAIYTLPDAPDPRGASPSPTASNDATVPSKPARRVNRKSATPPIKGRAKARVSVSAPRKAGGNGVYAAVIADLEAERTKALDRVEQINTAIATLRALA